MVSRIPEEPFEIIDLHPKTVTHWSLPDKNYLKHENSGSPKLYL